MPAKRSTKGRGARGTAPRKPLRAPEPDAAARPPRARAAASPPPRGPWAALRIGAIASAWRPAELRSRLRGAVAAESPLWVVLLLVVPILAVFLELTVGVQLDQPPGVDKDYWWHLATGNWILDHHRIPTTDPFSWTHGGQEWIAHEWLAAVLLALLDRVGGYAASIVFTAVVAVAGFWRLLAGARFYGMSRRTAALAMLLFGSVFISRIGVMVVRPQVWSWALLAILCAELAAYDTGRRRRLWILPPLFALWVNINLTALIGFGCLGAFVLDRLIRR
ncbi:MAG: hypothetical protein IT336_08385, partial [Thermomicrobiales bacterium]|nr:hypothetical protein [Thermomicrobiales bacterium]